MRPVTLPYGDIQASLRELERASHENDVVDIAQNFTITGNFAQTTNLNVGSPSLANIAAVLATLIVTMQRGGFNRTT